MCCPRRVFIHHSLCCSLSLSLWPCLFLVSFVSRYWSQLLDRERGLEALRAQAAVEGSKVARLQAEVIVRSKSAPLRRRAHYGRYFPYFFSRSACEGKEEDCFLLETQSSISSVVGRQFVHACSTGSPVELHTARACRQRTKGSSFD